MYLSRLRVFGLRCFKDQVIKFKPGLNLIIGENNSGKTSVLRALQLLFPQSGRERPDFTEFHRPFVDFKTPPRIRIEATFAASEENSAPERGLICSWLTKYEEPWEAQLTYDFFLPENDEREFTLFAESFDEEERAASFELLLQRFMPKFITKFWRGNPNHLVQAQADKRNKLGMVYVDAVRDAVGELASGRNSLLKKLLTQNLDLNIPNREKVQKENDFLRDSRGLRQSLAERLSTENLFRLVEKTGAKDGGHPSLEGDVSEIEFLTAIKLHIQKSGFAHPIQLNGLGYNNLVYISLVIASIDFEMSEEINSENAIFFSLLAIEEPEAHLHPVLQSRFLDFLQSRLKERKSSQVFLSTHSTHIVSAAKLDSLICLEGGHVAYPGACFPENDENEKPEQKYVERFLDATKSNLLFLKGVILVEGLTELLLIEAMAKRLQKTLSEYHVGVIAVGESTAPHFSYLYKWVDKSSNSLKCRAAFIVDSDPAKLSGKPRRWHSCYPYELKSGDSNYRESSSSLKKLKEAQNVSKSMKVFSNRKTFEYDLAFENFRSLEIITDFCNNTELERFLATESPDFSTFQDFSAIEAHCSDETERLQHLWATLYVRSISEKGAHAQELRERFFSQKCQIAVPKYIKNAIQWACSIET